MRPIAKFQQNYNIILKIYFSQDFQVKSKLIKETFLKDGNIKQSPNFDAHTKLIVKTAFTYKLIYKNMDI